MLKKEIASMTSTKVNPLGLDNSCEVFCLLRAFIESSPKSVVSFESGLVAAAYCRGKQIVSKIIVGGVSLITDNHCAPTGAAS